MTTEQKIQNIKDFRPIDDVFFEVLADDSGVCEEILRVIMNDDKLTVDEVIVQSSNRNIYGRSVRLDALCYLGSGKRVNIEVQRSDNDDHLRRVRFNSASITESNPGERFADVVDVYVVYISEFDIFNGNSPIYHIDKLVRETGEVIDDGSLEIFVNTVVDDGSDIAELMSCFKQKVVNNPKFPKLSNRVKMLKTTEGGASVVCEVMERYQAEAVKEGSIRTLVETGCDFNASKDAIIRKLVNKFQLTEAEAIAKYEQYAPVLR